MTNNETGPATFDAWILAELPSGSFYGPLLGPVDLTLPGGASIDRDRTQSVPANAPAGTYGYWGYVGTYPLDVWSSDSFTFEKLATGDGSIVTGWECSGEPFEEITKAKPPTEFALIGCYPNPFNPMTVLSYKLQVASRINLTVYDVTGCLVAELVNGWRDAGVHEVTFDGSELGSGVYIYKMLAGDFEACGKMVLIK